LIKFLGVFTTDWDRCYGVPWKALNIPLVVEVIDIGEVNGKFIVRAR
jgi:hypothetical protein